MKGMNSNNSLDSLHLEGRLLSQLQQTGVVLTVQLPKRNTPEI